MADATTQPELQHDAPSVPASPLPKRTKYSEPVANLSVACRFPAYSVNIPLLIHTSLAILNDQQPTPPPTNTLISNPMASTSQSRTSMPPMSLEPPPPALQVKLLSASAKPPTRGSAFAAGYDIYAAKETVVPARGKALVDTDISIALPAGTYGRIAPRSGLASKHSIDTGAGVIDADYRGPVKVLLFNFSDADFKIAVHERIAQLIIERVSACSRTR